MDATIRAFAIGPLIASLSGPASDVGRMKTDMAKWLAVFPEYLITIEVDGQLRSIEIKQPDGSTVQQED